MSYSKMYQRFKVCSVRPQVLFVCGTLLLTQAARGAEGSRPLLLQGGLLIDGTGRRPTEDAQVLIRDNRIERVGTAGSFDVPAGVRRIDTSGKTLLPGFIDHHFHLDHELVPLFLAHGVTSVKDPGAWIERYEPVKRWQEAQSVPGPRLFLCGPTIDGPGPAYPDGSVAIQSPAGARLTIRRLIAQGAEAIKIYFRLPLDSIRAVVEEAHRHRVPVTAHLEIVDPRDAIEMGIDGLEHLTSLGQALISPMEAEKYRQAVMADNMARAMGRYRMWAALDPHSKRALDLAHFLARKKTFVDVTLAIFEKRPGDGGEEIDVMVRATENMKVYTGVLHRAGVRIVVGSHSNVPHAPKGLAYHRELEMLVESGLTPHEAIIAATRVGAEFLGRENDLGTIEEGKLADILILDANPLEDIRNSKTISSLLMDGTLLKKKEILELPPIGE